MKVDLFEWKSSVVMAAYIFAYFATLHIKYLAMEHQTRAKSEQKKWCTHLYIANNLNIFIGITAVYQWLCECNRGKYTISDDSRVHLKFKYHFLFNKYTLDFGFDATKPQFWIQCHVACSFAFVRNCWNKFLLPKLEYQTDILCIRYIF